MPSWLDDVLRRRVVWVTGKGGTGKSTVAAALALLGAERGRRTLLIDVEANGDAARFLDAPPPRYEPRRIAGELFHLALHPEDVLDEYLHVALRVPRVRRIGPLRRVFEFIATAAPGVKEVLIAGKVGFEERAAANGRPRWDLVVVDAAPSGQVLSHLRGPRTVQEMVGVGLIRNQTAWVRDIIEDPDKTCLVVVALPEEMPVTETRELLAALPKEVRTPVAGIVANRAVRITDPARLAAAIRAAPDSARRALELWATLADNHAPYLDELHDLHPSLAVVPLLGFEHHGMEVTRRVARALEEAQ